MAGTHRRTFSPTPDSVRAVRAFLRYVLGDSRVDVEDVTLLGSELATNAVVHARTEYEVTVLVSEDLVRVEVWDLDPRLPQARSSDGGPGGRGLPLVEALACRWGAETSPAGKVVWFEATG